jgi:maltooligosyltrehalose trehalohydrolase
LAETVAVELELAGAWQRFPLQRLSSPQRGLRSIHRHEYFAIQLDRRPEGTLYRLVVDGRLQPDPASRWQPQGVHGPSALFDPAAYDWSDGDWSGIPLRNCIIYELHIGTFTPAGRLDSAIAALPHLVELGVTAVEIMPVAQFPGDRNWGYDGTFPYAVQHSYGGPRALQQFVDACHQQGLAVFLDVVYNHLGHEGNYLWDMGPYFNQAALTPWGPAINVDGPHSEPVRHYFIENALYWLEHFHLDGLRLDAVDTIIDTGAYPFLQELGDRVRELSGQVGRSLHLIAESALNDPRYVNDRENGGYGLAGQWADDLHHALHAYLTGEQQEYYQDFGSVTQILQAYSHPFVFSGQYSHYFRRRRGTPNPPQLPAERFVVASQNHDQIGNRLLGDRLSTCLDAATQRLVAGLVVLSPYTPLLFMGEEYGETAPFHFFTDYGDPTVIEGMRAGRQEEFSDWFGGIEDVSDPQRLQWLEESRILLDRKYHPEHAPRFRYYQRAIALRRQLVMSGAEPPVHRVIPLASEGQHFALHYTAAGTTAAEVLVVACLPGGEGKPLSALPDPTHPHCAWICQLDSNHVDFGGEGGMPEGTCAQPPAMFTQPGLRVFTTTPLT